MQTVIPELSSLCCRSLLGCWYRAWLYRPRGFFQLLIFLSSGVAILKHKVNTYSILTNTYYSKVILDNISCLTEPVVKCWLLEADCILLQLCIEYGFSKYGFIINVLSHPLEKVHESVFGKQLTGGMFLVIFTSTLPEWSYCQLTRTQNCWCRCTVIYSWHRRALLAQQCRNVCSWKTEITMDLCINGDTIAVHWR